MHVFVVYASYASRVHLNDLWTNMCCVDLVSTHGTCFWDCRFMHVQQSVKIVRRAKHMYYIERVSQIWVRFRTAQNARIWSFLKKTRCYICFTRLCCSLLMWTSRRCGCIYALCLLFHFRARLLALPCSHHNFCHFVIATMRPLAPLQCWER